MRYSQKKSRFLEVIRSLSGDRFTLKAPVEMPNVVVQSRLRKNLTVREHRKLRKECATRIKVRVAYNDQDDG